MTADEARKINKAVTEPRSEMVRQALYEIHKSITRRAELGWWKVAYPLPDSVAFSMRPEELVAIEKSLRADGFHVRASQDEILEVSW